MTYTLIFLASLLGLFGHWLTRYKQARTTSTFKEYMMNDWTSTAQSVFANLSSSMGLCVALPDDIHGKLLLMTVFTAYTAGYMFDSTLNKDAKLELPETPTKEKTTVKAEVKHDQSKSISDILDDDAAL